MQVELHDKLTQPAAIKATRVLICDDFGTPICLCVQWDANHNRVFRVGDPDFNAQLQMHGITRTVVVQKVEGKGILLGR